MPGRDEVAQLALSASEVLVERYVPGRELTVAVMGDRALGVARDPAAHGAFYDYDREIRARRLATI